MRFFSFVLRYGLFLLFCACAYSQNHQAAVGDLNGDGKPDLVVANPTLNNIGIFLNTGSGALGPGTFLAVAGRPDSVSIADINSDGHPDILLVVTDSTSASHLQAMLGDGNGGFAAAVTLASGSTGPSGNTVVADFNGDGFPDIAFGDSANPPQISILSGDGHGNFSAPRVITVANDSTTAVELLLLDADKNGKPDLIVNTARVASIFIHESFLLLNNGSAGFSVSHLGSAGFAGDTAGFVTAVADFNGDGNPDALFGPNSPAFILFGDGQGGALYASPGIPNLATPQGFAADIDGNQTIDLVSSNSYFPGNGHGGFGDPVPLLFPAGSTLIAVADFNGDGKPDFAVQSGTNVSVVLNTLTAPASIAASTQLLVVSSSAATTSVGLPVTLTAAVSSYGGIPAGTIAFFEGAQPLGSAPVDIYGVAEVTVPFAAAGLHNNLTASFAGTLDASTNTAFLNTNALSSASVSVNSSQPTASAPTVSLDAFPNPARARNPVTITASVTSSSGTPTGNIVLRADGNPLASFPIGKAIVIFPTTGLHNLQATYGGDATFPQAASPVLVEDVRLTVPADFTMDTSPQSATVRAGQSASFDITVNPVGDLASTIGFSCAGLPAAASCSFSPASVTPGINPVTTTLTITTTAPSTAVPLNAQRPGPLLWLLAFAGCFGLLLSAVLHAGGIRKAALGMAALAFVVLLGSCGGGGGTPSSTNGTPPGTSSVTVTATSATNHNAVLSITVTQ